jgi:hypothetical protein
MVARSSFCLGLGAWLAGASQYACQSCNRTDSSAVPGPASPIGAEHSRSDTGKETRDIPSFLVVTDQQQIVMLSATGERRVVVPAAATWLYDRRRALLWTLFDGALSATDLRRGTAPVVLAKGLQGVAYIWVEWPPAENPEFVRTETGCEPTRIVEIQLGKQPALRFVPRGDSLQFLGAGRRWLAAQQARPVSLGHVEATFSSQEQWVELPPAWTGCDAEGRCGLSLAFGKSALRLVLVRESSSGDCTLRGCLLFDPETKRFASPPVVRSEDGRELLAPQPMHWATAVEAQIGLCGPYSFDASGSQFLLSRYLCPLRGPCQDLGATALGWLSPGPVVGDPG